MKNNFAYIFLLIFTTNSFSQQITFQKTYGSQQEEFGSSVMQTDGDGFIVVGTMYDSNSQTGDCYIVRTDSVGSIVWKKAYGDLNDDWGYSVDETMDSCFVFAGTSNSFGNGNYDFYLIKTNPAGTILWSKTFGGTGHDECTSVQQTFDGGFILAGYKTVFGAGTDACLIKTDPAGNVIWSKTYGGSGDEFNVQVIQTTDSGFIVMGSTTSFGAGGFDDIFLLKTDASGDTLWSKTYGGSSEDDGYSVQQTSDGGFVITGSTISFNFDYDVYMIKTDAFGNILWSKVYNGISDDDYGYSGRQTNDGGYIIVGTTLNFGFPSGYKVLTIKTDATGNPLWAKIYGGPGDDWGYSIQQTNDDGYILAGGIGYFYLVKTDISGNSGCNEVNKTVTSFTPTTVVTYPAFDVSSVSLNVTSPTTLVTNVGSFTTICGPVGIQSLIPYYQSEISINPNPSNGNFIIHFNNKISEKTIRIFDVTGKIIYMKDEIKNAEEEINLTSVPKGIYFLKVIDKDKTSVNKIVLQ